MVLHAIVAALISLWPAAKTPILSEPTFVELRDIPQLKSPEPEVVRPSDQRNRVQKETAPRPPSVSTPTRPGASGQVQPRQQHFSSEGGKTARVTPNPVPAQRASEPGSSVSELLRRKPSQQPPSISAGNRVQPNLLPNAARMARLEENYRRRFADDLDEGSTRFLNTDDIQFGSFLRRFETAVYGVWRYPQEAALKGIEGVTPVKITFNRHGEIVRVVLLESSGSKILDEEVMRTLRLIGPMGSFPKTYNKEEFHLIAFFHYGNSGRGRLH